MNFSKEREKLINKYQKLFWYMDKAKLQQISDAVLVEFILNYGTWEAFLELKKLYGVKKLAKIYIEISSKSRSNLFPKIRNFFNHYFQRHAPEYFK